MKGQEKVSDKAEISRKGMQPPEFSILNTKTKLNKRSKLNSFLTFLGNKQRIELYKDPQMKKQR